MPKHNSFDFLNFTDIEDKEAKKLVGKLRDIVTIAERDREGELARAEDSLTIWKNEFWDQEDEE